MIIKKKRERGSWVAEGQEDREFWFVEEFTREVGTQGR